MAKLSDAVPEMNLGPSAWKPHAPEQGSLFGPRGLPVGNSADLQRILKLPRREPVREGTATAEAYIQHEMAKYSRGPLVCECKSIDAKRPCLTCLLWAQAWMLYEIEWCGGMLASAPVGAGKTMVTLLAALALRKTCPLSLLLIPATLVDQIQVDYQLIAEHFYVPGIVVHLNGKKTFKRESEWLPPHLRRDPNVPELAPVLHVLKYTQLSHKDCSAWLEENAQPYAIIADECDALKDMTSVRTIRVASYLEKFKNTKFIGMTGSLTDQSITEYGHLALWALRAGSPLPVDPNEVEEWSRALDAVPNPCPPGALQLLCNPGESVRHAFRRRLSETPGFVMIGGKQTIVTAEGEEVQLNIIERKAPPIPSIILEALEKVRNFERPDSLAGNEFDATLEDPLEQARCLAQVATGMFYKWIFPRGESVELRLEWYAARKAYYHELRNKYQRGETYLDSPGLCEDAAKRYWGDLPKDPRLPDWKSEHWPRWRDIRDQVQPETEAVRLSRFLVEDTVLWAQQNTGIVWYGMKEFAQWCSQHAREDYGVDLPIFGQGSGPAIMRETGERSIIASIKSHGRGRDGLQFRFSKQLVAQMLASNRVWQQCLDAKTEILTDKGWLGIDSEWGDARAAAYDINSGTVTWSKAERFERRLGDEKMYGISNPHLDIRVTAGHRMICERYRRRGRDGRGGSYHTPREFVRADEMPTHARLPIAGMQDAPGGALTDHELMFLGLFLTDGSLDKSNNVICLYQSERYPVVMRVIDRTIEGCGFRARRTVHTENTDFTRRFPVHRWYISKGPPKRLLDRRPGLTGWARLEPYIDKNLNDSYEQLDRRQLLVLLEGMWLGDGSKTPGTYNYNRYQPRTWNIATKRKGVADRMQSLCLRRGLRCNISLQTSGVWMMRISEDQVWSVHTYAGDGRPRWKPVAANQSERVWCVEVDTGAIVTRRNGKAAVVGNCLGRLHRRGQSNLEVTTEIYLHVDELEDTLNQALRRGEYVRDTLEEDPRLLTGWKG